MPQAIPKVIADDLFQFHGNPFAWFAGQFFLYLTRPNEKFKQFLADRKKALNITRPYVGYVPHGCLLEYITSLSCYVQYTWCNVESGTS